MNSIVSVDWLNENLKNPDLIILDASLQKERSNISSTLSGYSVVGARYFDIMNKFSNTNDTYPNALPSPEQFEQNCQFLGIKESSIIVIYDLDGIYSSPRAWWLFKIMGHKSVSVLDGGFPEWLKNDFRIEKNSLIEIEKGNFKTNFNKSLVRNFEEVLENTSSNNETLIDVRSSDRFNGLVPEPRKDLRSGNISNSINLPYSKVLKDGKFKSKEELKEIMSEYSFADISLIFSCGSGITACIVFLALDQFFKNWGMFLTKKLALAF